MDQPAMSDESDRYVIDGRSFPVNRPPSTITLDPYQRDNLRSVLEHIRSGDGTSARSLNTGDWVTEVMDKLGGDEGTFANLILNDEGYPTAWAYEAACAALEKHQARADRAEAVLRSLPAYHTIRITDRDWTIAHPMSCRFSEDGLHGCQYTVAAATIAGAEFAALPVGVFYISLDVEDNENLIIEGRVESDEPEVPVWMREALHDILATEG